MREPAIALDVGRVGRPAFRLVQKDVEGVPND
jgi:hypothetical protein